MAPSNAPSKPNDLLKVGRSPARADALVRAKLTPFVVVVLPMLARAQRRFLKRGVRFELALELGHDLAFPDAFRMVAIQCPHSEAAPSLTYLAALTARTTWGTSG